VRPAPIDLNNIGIIAIIIYLMRNAIITSSDQNCEQFVLYDWMKSLADNVNLSNIDVIILDYGLSPGVKEALKRRGAIIYPFHKNGAIPTVRFMATTTILRNSDYDQVMTCDGGDLIFQQDISHLFEQDKDSIRAVCEGMAQPFGIYLKRSLNKDHASRIKKATRGKKMINSGFILAPRQKFIQFLDETQSLVLRNTWGVEQPIFNYIFYRDGFVELPCAYNFAIGSSIVPYDIKDSKFYFTDGKLIPVVHNIGRMSWFRPINKFGYGPGKNHKNFLKYFAVRSVFKLFHTFYDILNI
jgi:hypothetical protein